MRSLFFKIFACFWLSHLLVVSLVFAILTATQEPRDGARRGDWRGGPPRTVSGEVLARHARAAAALWDSPNGSSQQKKVAQAKYFDSIQRETGLRAALFDARGALLGGQPSREAGAVALRAARSGEAEFDAHRGGVTSARRAVAPSGAIYVLTLQPPRDVRPPGGPPRGPFVGGRRLGPPVRLLGFRLDRGQAYQIAQLISVFVAAGIVAFGLARYLTAPTVKLRRATHQLAGGDLSTRVGPAMGRRRDELADLGRDFDLMAARIEELMLSQRRLLGDISHELGSPLARLNVALELAQQGADEETRGYLARIERESGRLNTLIGQLLTLTRLENARPDAHSGASDEVASVDLSQLVEDVCADADFEAQRLGRSVKLERNDPCRIAGNAELLRSAVENVVRNAVLHAPQSSSVEVALSMENPQTALVRVRDYGSGVPNEALSQLFRPFYRVAEARDRQSGGVGLGLSITQRAVAFHGGTVEAFNAHGGGLLIEMRLPVNNR
ncbi:MAG: HAMP domain-containing protein [Armatimonadetes bacterium]|nr:HAMP domain-containing protein [Armatimonadota bacterium]